MFPGLTTFSSSRVYYKKMMGQCRRSSPSPTLLLWVLLLLLGHCQSSRTSNVFYIKPRYPNKGHYTNFMPRHFPIPTSGPSRRHNDIGLQSWRSSSSSLSSP